MKIDHRLLHAANQEGVYPSKVIDAILEVSKREVSKDLYTSSESAEALALILGESIAINDLVIDEDSSVDLMSGSILGNLYKLPIGSMISFTKADSHGYSWNCNYLKSNDCFIGSKSSEGFNDWKRDSWERRGYLLMPGIRDRVAEVSRLKRSEVFDDIFDYSIKVLETRSNIYKEINSIIDSAEKSSTEMSLVSH